MKGLLSRLEHSLHRILPQSDVRRIQAAIAAGEALPEDAVLTLCARLQRPSTWRWRQQRDSIELLARIAGTERDMRSARNTLANLLNSRPRRFIGCYLTG